MSRTVPAKVMSVGRARTLVLFVLAVLVAASIGVLVEAKDAHAKTFRVNSDQDAHDNSSTDGECATEPFDPALSPIAP